MMNSRTAYAMLGLAALSTVTSSGVAQTTSDYAVQISATVQTNPPQITLFWVADPLASAYTVYRKTRDASSWGAGTLLPAPASNYVDTIVAVGNAYEYRIDKTPVAGSTGVAGRGYIYAGIQAPLVESRGKVILLVDNTFTGALATELARLQQDLVGDGWTVLRHDVARTSTVSAVKAVVSSDYFADPANVKALFLFGHVPVPYAGNFAPDGHTEHVGAWPADVYYADLDGAWTDSSVNTTSASDPRNRNVPNDGKFDQSTLPSDVELQVGRVDLGNLPSFAQTEAELLRQYLNKDHNFRVKNFRAESRGVVNDNFGTLYGEAFAANGYRNFAPFFGATNTTPIPPWTWVTSLASQSYLWGYGCGPGTYSSAAGVSDTSNLAANDPKVVFTMLFGSYFGDWDTQDNFLRAPLASPSYTLASAWAGRPCWQFHHMALGETIGFSTRLSQNNSTTYGGGNNTRGVHISLMGDPTLRLHPVTPPLDLLVLTNFSGGVDLRWTPSTDAVLGYHVYRSPTAAGPFTRLTTSLLREANYSDTLVSSNVYMVRAVRLESGASGTYYNASQGIFQTLSGSATALSASRLTLTVIGPGSFLITGTGMPGEIFQLQANDGMSGANWRILGTVTNDPSGVFRFTDFSSAGQRVYRTVSQ